MNSRKNSVAVIAPVLLCLCVIATVACGCQQLPICHRCLQELGEIAQSKVIDQPGTTGTATQLYSSTKNQNTGSIYFWLYFVVAVVWLFVYNRTGLDSALLRKLTSSLYDKLDAGKRRTLSIISFVFNYIRKSRR